MTKKGQNKRTKAISMPKVTRMSRKENVWAVTTKSGPYTKETSVALGVVVRNYTKLVNTMREAKKILSNGDVKVNGVIRKKHQFPVGLFDLISIPRQKLFYIMLFDKKGRLVLNELDSENKEKICKVTNKVMTKKGVQLTTNDARTFVGVKANVGDSLKISLPEGKIKEVLEFKEGMIAYITKGAHCSKTAKISSVVEGSIRKKELVKLSDGEKAFETISKNVFVVGKKNPELVGIN